MNASDSRCLADRIKSHALTLGFQLCGVTTPDSPGHLLEYQTWLDDGLHADMSYMASPRAREMRADPRALFPACKSILVLAANYFQGDSGSSEASAQAGRVARYAWGRDYHEVLISRLKDLIAFVEVAAGRPVQHRLYTDTGPVLEREMAQRAGLGWIGKNTMLINPDIGSWTLLAEAMLDLELPSDEPFVPDLCGSCTRCIDACPTDAILLEPRRVDSGSCISYLTIEHRGTLPVERRADLKDWIFGCDVCQEVCPWNQRFAHSQEDSDFAPRSPLPNPQYLELLDLSQAEFSTVFRGTALKRAKRVGLLRNAAVALGNASESADAVSALERILRSDPDAVVRAHAAWALAQCDGDTVQSMLRAALEIEVDQAVLAEIETALEARTSFMGSE